MKVKILEEHGCASAMLGLSLSYKQSTHRMFKVVERLAFQQEGHNKFLESIVLWLDITAPRYWWQQFDTYRIGVTKQSESTMHTITKGPLTQEDFEHPVPERTLEFLNALIREKDWERVKYNLPESFLQRRVVCFNYMALQRMIRQRQTHKLREWHTFITEVLNQAESPEFLKR